MKVTIALHQSRWLRLSVRRMILCGYPAAKRQTEHDHTQNGLISVIAMFQRHTFLLLDSNCFEALVASANASTRPKMYRIGGPYLPARLALLPAARYYVTDLT